MRANLSGTEVHERALVCRICDAGDPLLAVHVPEAARPVQNCRTATANVVGTRSREHLLKLCWPRTGRTFPRYLCKTSRRFAHHGGLMSCPAVSLFCFLRHWGRALRLRHAPDCSCFYDRRTSAIAEIRPVAEVVLLVQSCIMASATCAGQGISESTSWQRRRQEWLSSLRQARLSKEQDVVQSMMSTLAGQQMLQGLGRHVVTACNVKPQHIVTIMVYAQQL